MDTSCYFFPIFAIFAILHQFAILICWHFAYPLCTSYIQSFQYIFQSADPSAHSMAFQCFCVYVTSTSTSQIQTATAADVKLHRTSIPSCPVISLWLRAMLSQYPSFGGEVLCLHNPIRFQGKTCKFTRCQVISPRKIGLLWWHCWVTSYNHKWWLLSWRVLKRKEQLKDDANLSWKILLTWEFSCLFGCSLTLFSLKSIDTLTSWMHYYSEKTHFLLIRETTCTVLANLRTQTQKRAF